MWGTHVVFAAERVVSWEYEFADTVFGTGITHKTARNAVKSCPFWEKVWLLARNAVKTCQNCCLRAEMTGPALGRMHRKSILLQIIIWYRRDVWGYQLYAYGHLHLLP